MAKARFDKRRRLLRAAAELTHRRGFRGTSLATLSRAARVPLGNLYYYFRSKQEIASAIIEDRAAYFRRHRAGWDEFASPRDRLVAFVDMTVDARHRIARDGCPLGSLCSELNKQGGAIAKDATKLLAEPLAWFEAQFRSMGKGNESASLAVHLLSALQGMAILANTFDDPDLVLIETKRLERWIREL